jgi:hypothetical protein
VLIVKGVEQVLELCELFNGNDPFCDEPLTIHLKGRGTARNELIHLRLGETRLIAFIVAMSAVSQHLNKDVPVEGLPKGNR